MGKMGQAFGTLSQGRELWRKTVGLVGLGAVGHQGVPAGCSGFGTRIVIAFDPYVDPGTRHEPGRRGGRCLDRRAAPRERLREPARTRDRGHARSARKRGTRDDEGRRVPREHGARRARRRGCAARGTEEWPPRRGGHRRVRSRAARLRPSPARARKRDRDAARGRQHGRGGESPGPHHRRGPGALAARRAPAARAQSRDARVLLLDRAPPGAGRGAAGGAGRGAGSRGLRPAAADAAPRRLSNA